VTLIQWKRILKKSHVEHLESALQSAIDFVSNYLRYEKQIPQPTLKY